LCSAHFKWFTKWKSELKPNSWYLKCFWISTYSLYLNNILKNKFSILCGLLTDIQYLCIFVTLSLALFVRPCFFAMFLVNMHMSPTFNFSSCGGVALLLNWCKISSVSILFNISYGSSTSQKKSFENSDTYKFGFNSCILAFHSFTSLSPTFNFSSCGGVALLLNWCKISSVSILFNISYGSSTSQKKSFENSDTYVFGFNSCILAFHSFTSLFVTANNALFLASSGFNIEFGYIKFIA